MIAIKRTTSENPDFQILADELEQDFKIRDGDDYSYNAQFNTVDTLGHVLVAYLQDEPVGCGAFREYTTDTMEVKRMYVRTDHRGKGIASTILKELENWGIELRFSVCVLETGKNQPEAINLYKRSGYQIIPNFGRYVNSQNSVCFTKKL